MFDLHGLTGSAINRPAAATCSANPHHRSKLSFLLTKLPPWYKIWPLWRYRKQRKSNNSPQRHQDSKNKKNKRDNILAAIANCNFRKTMSPETWLSKIKDHFGRYEGAIIAYSGGVDSALLAYVAHQALRENMLAVLADSPSLARREYRHALDFANEHDIPLYIIETQEMQNPFYGANQGDRCYHCKKALFQRIEELRELPGNPLCNLSWPVFYGANLDDLGDYRPGIQAADESAIRAPYVELKIGKNQIRSICASLGLEVADKPAMPCLASRIAYGQEVNREKLKQVEAAENLLRDLGFQMLRVRHHGDTARIEILPEDFNRALQHRTSISKKLHELGFLYVALDIDGFKSGSLNAALKNSHKGTKNTK